MTPGTIGIALALAIVGILAIVIFIRAHVVVCAPNEAVIFSGRKKGYRIIRGGRGFRRPLIETVSRISLNTIPIEVTVKKALSAGMIPLDVDGMATVKIAGDPEGGLDHAVERFLGRTQHEIQTVAKQTLEGSLRGVIATRTPEEANAERLGVGDAVSEAVRQDFSQLGLVLDTFKIQHLSDTEGYLDAIGRKRSAAVRRDAKVAEARADAEARDVAANAKRDAVVAETSAEEAIVDAEHGVRMRRAERAAASNQAEQIAEVAKRMARIEEERKLEEIRVARNELREKANTVVPAEASSQARALTSQGEASRIRENGKATADALAEILGGTGPDMALNLDVPIAEVTERMLARGRDDDTEEAISRRLELYEAETAPLLAWFEERGRLTVVDGLGTEDEVFTRLTDVISAI